MSILYNRALLLAKLEPTFRTDPLPRETIFSATFDAADVTNAANTIDFAAHNLETGDGPFRLVETGTLPSGLTEDTNYWIIDISAGVISLADSYADALAGTATALADDGTGTPIGTMTEVASNALLVEDPNTSVEVTQLNRNNVRTHLGQLPSRIARKVATMSFAHEVRAAGVSQLLVPTAPAVGSLLRACGYAETYVPAGLGTILDDAPVEVFGPTNTDGTPSGDWTFTKTVAYTETLPRIITFTCVTPGATGVAAFDITSPASGAQAASSILAQVMADTVALEITVDGTPAEITPDNMTVFVAGDTFVVHLAPPGVLYTPVSDSLESITLKVFYDGILHEINGARGTFTMEGAAGDFARFNFTFTGDYVDVIDLALPTAPIYESTLPPQVELAALSASGGLAGTSTGLCAQSFTIDSGNDVQIRECINGSDSVEGALIVARTPVGGFNPETELEATHPFWANLAGGNRISFGVRVGSVEGNVVSVFAPYAQYTEIAYTNRNEIRAYDVSLAFAADDDAGNDELRFMFS